MTQTKTFYSEDGTDIRVTHPDGSVALIGEKPRELPKKLWKAAIRAGALTSDMKVSKADLSDLDDGDDAGKRRKAIYDAMLKAWEDDEDGKGEEGAFTGAGVPNVRFLEKKLGFDISGEERDQIWTQVQKENAVDEGDESESDANQ